MLCVKLMKDVVGGVVLDVEFVVLSVDVCDCVFVLLFGKMYDVFVWGGVFVCEFYFDCVKGGVLALRTRLDRGEGEDASRGYVMFGRYLVCDVVVEYLLMLCLYCVI